MKRSIKELRSTHFCVILTNQSKSLFDLSKRHSNLLALMIFLVNAGPGSHVHDSLNDSVC